MRKRQSQQSEMTMISRETLENVARIVGSGSAAAQALADADRHPGRVQFWTRRGCILVEKFPKEE